jgi:hypothetical protein
MKIPPRAMRMIALSLPPVTAPELIASVTSRADLITIFEFGMVVSSSLSTQIPMER